MTEIDLTLPDKFAVPMLFRNVSRANWRGIHDLDDDTTLTALSAAPASRLAIIDDLVVGSDGH